MDLLLTHREKLSFDYQPAVYSWFWGYHQTQLIDKTEEKPFAIAVSISLKNEFDDELYIKLSKMLKEQQESDKEIGVIIPERCPNKELLGIKPEFQDQAAEIEERNQITAKKIIELCEQLDELGCNYETYGFKQEPIPEDWYDWQEGLVPLRPFIVWCKSGTQFYEFMIEHNLLEQKNLTI